jgi:hypothetical protein
MTGIAWQHMPTVTLLPAQRLVREPPQNKQPKR